MFTLSQFPLPYEIAMLAPHISATTMEFHYEKHLATYIRNLNDLIAGGEFADMPLLEIIRRSNGAIFNNAAQVFNHDFFFHSMRPATGEAVPWEIADAFGGADAFRDAFRAAALGVFGSGWVWLVSGADGAPTITTTANADTPVAHGVRPLLCLDVWEHAYYLDYQNRRAEYIDAFIDHVANWGFALENMRADQ